MGAVEVEGFLTHRGREGGVGLDAEPGQECGPVPLKEVLGEPLRGLKVSSQRSGRRVCRSC